MFRTLFIILWVMAAGCFGRLNLPTEEELAPSLAKAFTFAQHGRALSKEDAANLRTELSGERLALFDRLMRNLKTPCPKGDRACGAEKLAELAGLYRDYAELPPQEFEAQLTAAAGLFFLGQSAKRGDFDGAEALIQDGAQRVAALLQRYPKEPMVHGQIAFMKTFEPGKKDEIRAHIARCLELDPTTDWCRKLARKY